MDLGIILEDGLGDLLDEDGFSGAGRRDDEAALTLPDRREHVEDARRILRRLDFHLQPDRRLHRRQRFEQRRRLGPVLIVVLGRPVVLRRTVGPGTVLLMLGAVVPVMALASLLIHDQP